MIAQLISTPSVSCVHADMDMSNRAVIDLVAEWAENLGFEIELQAIDERKYNLIARAGSGSDGLVLSGHTDTVPCDPALWSSDPFAACENWRPSKRSRKRRRASSKTGAQARGRAKRRSSRRAKQAMP